MTANHIQPQLDLTVHLPLVRSIASSVHRRLPRHVDFDDLVSDGMVGMLTAASQYDAARGVAFEMYARPRIRGAIIDALRTRDWVPRSVRRRSVALDETREELARRSGRSPTDDELATALGMTPTELSAYRRDAEVRHLGSLDAAGPDGSSTLLDHVAAEEPSSLDGLIDGEQREAVLTALRELPERERIVLSLHHLRGLSLKEVGQVLGVTESRVCQLKKQAIERLRKRLQPPSP